MRTMFDLCSGFGGASQAFEDSPKWNVERFENNLEVIEHKDTPVTNHVDLMKESPMGSPDLIWASPPCYEFSMAFEAPRAKSSREGGLDQYNPCTKLVERCFEIIQRLAPTFWVIENVIGSIRYLKPILGEPRMILGPYVLWGNFPLFDCEIDKRHKTKAGDRSRHDPLRSNHRAKIPYEISKALLEAIENQRTLF